VTSEVITSTCWPRDPFEARLGAGPLRDDLSSPASG